MPQQAKVVYLQGSSEAAGVTTAGNGVNGETSGVTGAITMEVLELTGGTATVNIEGSMDSTFTNAYLVGYQQINGVTALTRAAAALSVTANLKATYQILDAYPFIRARISAITGTVVVRLYYVAS